MVLGREAQPAAFRRLALDHVIPVRRCGSPWQVEQQARSMIAPSGAAAAIRCC
jgi:hypothetical protein